MEKFFVSVPTHKLGIHNFILGLITGFPVLLGVIYLFGTSNYFLSILLFMIALLLIVGTNYLLYKKNKNNEVKRNGYINMIVTFSLLVAGMFLSTEVIGLFMSVTM